jgi:UDP-2,4-diacetamido-2,4,6-trideoxy-beta-L-altropyranose hydrolase
MNQKQPQIAFRVDASILIGTGHIMRCLTLADALNKFGVISTFICRPHLGNLINEVIRRGHKVKILPKGDSCNRSEIGTSDCNNLLDTDWQMDAQNTGQIMAKERFDWLVVDHYALDKKWEQYLRDHCDGIMVIDDLADRPHDCDILLDQNLGRSSKDYFNLLQTDTIQFIGPNFALLRPEFTQLRSQSLTRRAQPELRHLLITMGGVDKDNVTGRVLRALNACQLPTDLHITVVMGAHAPHLADVKEISKLLSWDAEVVVGVDNMAQLMAESDLCIGAAGATSWERCYMGLPCLIIVLAPNQLTSAKALTKLQAARALDLSDLVGSLPKQMNELVSPENLCKLTAASKEITNGQGALLIANQIMSRLKSRKKSNFIH